MHITLSPQRRDDNLTVIKQGDTLTINGAAYDFSGVSDGATLPKAATDCEWLASDVRRVDGVLHMTLTLPNAADASEAARFPDPMVDPADGTLALPDQEVAEYDAATGAIDWSALVLPPTADESNVAWRETAELGKAEFLHGLILLEILTLEDAMNAARDNWPSALAGFLDYLTPEQSAQVQIEWATRTKIGRTDTYVLVLASYLGLTDAQVDALFGWEE